jgi:ATP phosphoribosyltransferase regulatory subunit
MRALSVAGKSSTERLALERQNAAIMAVFERAGFDQIAPDIIQPADIFLERSGEDIRARTFVFNDPEGHELCLRPDLTVPACRYHLSHAENPAAEARYSYLGPAFRFPDERLSPQEFNQAGLEWFGAGDAIAAEARMLKLCVNALEAAGATGLKVTLGDVGLFGALLNDTEMPDRWRRRLRHQFWRPQAFRELLSTFASGSTSKRSSISSVVDTLKTSDAATWLDKNNITLAGTRTLEEISERLAEKYADRSQSPLDGQAIENYLGIEGAALDVLLMLKTINGDKAYSAACAAYEQRLEAIEDLGLNPRRFKFSANFGREIEYYTGFVFQIEVDTKDGPIAIAGGGRYDELLSDLGSPQKVPAIGCAIHTERLQAVLA